MPGPAPKSNGQRRRRNAPRANTVKLPADGRPGAPPKWPLRTSELPGWAEAWALPQAVMWEKQRVEMLVARYVYLQYQLSDPESQESQTASFWGELRQLEDRLGLSPMALMRLQWEIDGSSAGNPDYDSPDNVDSDQDGNAHVIDIRERAAGNSV